jgi:phage/plasmid-like protein (TIGR03299 family)
LTTRAGNREILCRMLRDGTAPLQNREAFAFFDGIVGHGAAVYHTAGALGKSERIWILAKLPGCIRVAGNDITEKYLLLSNSHDGSSAVQVKFTPVRVVCQNTLMMALDDGPTLRVLHDRALHAHLDIVPEILGIINEEYRWIEETFVQMAARRMDLEEVCSYFRRVLPGPRDPADEEAREAVQHKRTELERFLDAGCGNDLVGARGTLWGAYNAVTEYVDHHSRKWKSPAGRLKSVCFGDGYRLKVRAFDVAQEILAGRLN